jgi:hypothetical protein
MSIERVTFPLHLFKTKRTASPDMRTKITHIGIVSNLAQRHTLTTTTDEKRDMRVLNREWMAAGSLKLKMGPLIVKRFSSPEALDNLNRFFQPFLAFADTRKTTGWR